MHPLVDTISIKLANFLGMSRVNRNMLVKQKLCITAIQILYSTFIWGSED